MAIPPLSEEQLKQARSAATAARRRRAEVKARLRAGTMTLPQALELAEDDDVIAHTKVFDILRSVPRVGERRARETMERHEIAVNRRLRGLGRHQIAGLKAEFS
ncbi:MAG: integration host factor, actinobacterial type [Propionibacteriaceae bacterium]